MILPAIGDYIVKRPGLKVPKAHYIPDNKKSAFWDDFYASVAKTIPLKAPVPDFEKLVNPYFGRFGMRWHPVTGSPHYYHVGIDISSPEETPFHPIERGLLDYSGYANINGNYIVMRHPHIFTEDGFVLHSLYMHCKTVNVKFSYFQKVLRKFLSTNIPLSNIAIEQNETIGSIGSSGHKSKYTPHLHLQLEFIDNKKEIRVAVDPMRMYGYESPDNLSAYLNNIDDFKLFYNRNYHELSGWRKFFEAYGTDISFL